MKQLIYDAKRKTETIVDVPDAEMMDAPVAPETPPTDAEVLDDLINLLIAQGVIAYV